MLYLYVYFYRQIVFIPLLLVDTICLVNNK